MHKSEAKLLLSVPFAIARARFLDEMNVLIPAYEHILQKFQATPLGAGEKRAGASK